MSIQAISNIGNIPNQLSTSSSSSNNNDFTSKFWDLISSLNDTQLQKQQITSDVLTGKSDDTTGMMVVAAKASLEMDIASTIRDKSITSWNNLMNMQI